MKGKLLGILMFLSLCGAAQVPGYQGLKFSVKYDLGFMHPIFEYRRGTLPLLCHNFSVDYVVSRSVSLGIRYGFMFYKQPPNKLAFNNNVGDLDINPADYLGKYQQHQISFIVKRFYKRKGFIAPVGRYITFGAYYQYATDQTILNTTNYSYPNSKFYFQSFKGTAHFGGVILGIGRNFIVANRVIIDFGGEINFPFAVVSKTASLEKRVTYRDVLYNNLMQLYIGVGMLAF
ncbi:MAG: hypothetical protein JWO06_1895 [Bacteroidota bacterium]|nr:hypothetical protein [Bacteroidota bacterium]